MGVTNQLPTGDDPPSVPHPEFSPFETSGSFQVCLHTFEAPAVLCVVTEGNNQQPTTTTTTTTTKPRRHQHRHQTNLVNENSVLFFSPIFSKPLTHTHTSVFPEALLLTAVFDLAVPEKQQRQRHGNNVPKAETSKQTQHIAPAK